MSRWTLAAPIALLSLAVLPAASVHAEPGYHPWAHPPQGVRTIDMRTLTPVEPAPPADTPRFDELDDFVPPDATPLDAAATREPSRMPEGWVQRGEVVMPRAVADGVLVDPDVTRAFEDIPGNRYPRKHTLYMNFVGGLLNGTGGGRDNSAESISVLAIDQDYPMYAGGNQKAIAIAEATQADLANYGVRVVYLERPPQILPYTMAMIGGTWQDTNIDGPAGGVAPSADCGALNQRHVVYVFASGGQPATLAANTASQEAGHAWGLDHTLNCDSVMSYCGGIGDQSFSTTCDLLCEEQCQGPNTIGCRLAHEAICGEGSDRQNEGAELTYLFGGNEPDVQPPIVEIQEPEDGLEVPAGSDVPVRAFIEDDYGGMGWSTTIDKDGEVLLDEIDYFKDNIGEDFRVAYNLSKLPAGVYTITVRAMDHAEQETVDTVTLYVGVEGGLDESGSGQGTGNDSTGSPPGGTAGVLTEGSDDDDGPGESGQVGQDDEGSEQGCGCASDPRGGSAPWWMALGVAAFVRRRSSRVPPAI
ncbi:MAG: MYXO-CTERM sorting domain-containing protein [Myxococcota bacterium]